LGIKNQVYDLMLLSIRTEVIKNQVFAPSNSEKVSKSFELYSS